MMRDDEFEELILAIRNNVCATFIFDQSEDELRVNEVIRDGDITRTQLLRLLEALGKSHKLNSFSFICSVLDLEIVERLISIVRNNKNLISFTVKLYRPLALIQFLPKQIQDLANAIKGCKRLTRFCASGFSLGGDEFQRLSRVVSQHALLTELELKDGAVSEKEVLLLSAALTGNERLKKLDLSNNHLTHAIVPALYQMLVVKNSLRTLRLHHNRLDDDSARLLFKALSANRSLFSLDVSDNQFTDKGAEYFCELLNVNFVLRKLLLSGHRFTFVTWMRFATALTMNVSIQCLTLHGHDDPTREMLFVHGMVILPLLTTNAHICQKLAEYSLPMFILRYLLADLLNSKFKKYNSHIQNPNIFFGMETVKNEVSVGMCSLKQLAAIRVYDLCMAGRINQANVNEARVVKEVGGYLTEIFNPPKLLKEPDAAEPDKKPKVDVKRMAARMRFEFAGQKKEREDGALVLTWRLQAV
jgi:hypothetical protein